MASSLVPLTAVGVRVKRKDLESLVGRLMRFSSIPPFHKLFLFDLYRLLRKPRCVNKKVPHAVFGELLVPMPDDLVLTRDFPAGDLLVSWRLFNAGDFAASCKADLRLPKFRQAGLQVVLANAFSAGIETDDSFCWADKPSWP